MTAEPASTMLRITGLTKRFQHGAGCVDAVRGINLTLPRGAFMAVMGASGSGKSTLLHLVGGLTRPTSGLVAINGANINAMSDGELTRFRRKHIGLVFQAFNLIPTLTGEENIALPALLGRENHLEKADEIARLAERLGITEVCRRRPDSMSGGEQQRIAIARALITSPSLILADEPTGSLDSVNGRRLCDTFRTLCQENNTTVLMVTHNPVVAFAATHFVILRDGQIVDQFERYERMTVQDLNQRYLAVMMQSPAEVVA